MIIRFTILFMVCCLVLPALAQDEMEPAIETDDTETSLDTSEAEKSAQDLKNNTAEIDHSIHAIESTIEAQKKALGITEEESARGKGLPGQKQAINDDEELPSGQEMAAESLPNTQGIPTIDEAKSREISKYFDEAAKNYDDILEGRPEAEIKTTDSRINNNQKLLKDNQSKLAESESSLRKVKLEYIRRFLIIKNGYQNKRIDKATYHRQLDSLAKEYEFKVSSLANDVTYYKDESSKTKDRLKALEELNRINKIVYFREKGTNAGEKKKEPQRPLTELEKMMQKLQSVGCFEAKNVWNEPDRK